MRTNFLNSVIRLAIFALGLGLFGTLPARAAILYDNLYLNPGDPPNHQQDGADPACVGGLPCFGPLYNSFSTGASNLDLSSVTLWLYRYDDAIPGTFSISVSTSPVAGSEIISPAVLDHSLVPTDPTAPFTYSFSSPVSLSPDTQYWIGLTSTGSDTSSIYWYWSTNLSGIGVDGESLSFLGNTYLNSDPDFGGAFQMQVATTPIPPTLLLFLSGLVVMGLFGWRGKRNAAAFA